MVPAEFLNELRSRSKIEPNFIREPLSDNVNGVTRCRQEHIQAALRLQ
jgi:hypothetical protein